MSYRIPLFDLNYGPEETRAVMEVVESRWISMGSKTAELEQRFADLIGTPHATAVSSCTSALHLALLMLDVGPGDEVLVPSLTFVATANCVRYAGAEPVFCDIVSDENPTIDPASIEANVTDKTKAIIVMHYGGFPCDMDVIQAIARKHDLKVVEDAAHAPLSQYRGQMLGTIGDVGCFSFFSNKNISTAEGGMVVTSSSALHDQARLLRSHGMTTLSYDRAKGHSTRYDVVALGYNYRIDDIRAALGLCQLDRLHGDLEARKIQRRRYLELLSDVPHLTLPFAAHDEVASNYIFPVVVDENSPVSRDDLRDQLAQAGIQTSVHYPAAHRFSIYATRDWQLPATEGFSDREMTLPMFAQMTLEQVDEVAQTVSRLLGKASVSSRR